jgi:hypothetical protein
VLLQFYGPGQGLGCLAAQLARGPLLASHRRAFPWCPGPGLATGGLRCLPPPRKPGTCVSLFLCCWSQVGSVDPHRTFLIQCRAFAVHRGPCLGPLPVRSRQRGTWDMR